MPLRVWLAVKKLTVSEFSRSINFDRRYVGQVMNGRVHAGKKLAHEIEKATDGAVKASSLMLEKIDAA